MGATGSSLKAKADAIRAHTRRAKEDTQAVDLQTQIQEQERELEGLEKSYRSIKVCSSPRSHSTEASDQDN